MNTQRLTRLLMTGILAAAITTEVAATGATDERPRRDPPLTFTIVGELDSAHLVDNAPSGISAGDVLVFSQTLYNRAKTRVIGSNRATCTRTTAPRGDYLCAGAFLFRQGQLRGGQITIQGIDPPESITRHPLVVTGGSGRYRGVGGAITVHHVNPTEDRFDFRLTR